MECGGLFGLVTLIVPLLVAGGGRDPSLPYNECIEEISFLGSQMFVWTHNVHDVDYIVSTPPCLDHTGAVVMRKCATVTGEWVPKKPPNCAYSPETFGKNRVCPEDLLEIPLDDDSRPLCVKISDEPVEWTDGLCFGSTNSILDLRSHEREKLYEYLRSIENMTAFWIPVQRAENNQYNPLIWKLPGRRWGDIFTMVDYNELSDKNCLIATVNPMPVFEMSHCNERRHAVCIYRNKNLAIRSVCPKSYGAMSYSPTICYGIEWDVEPHQGARQLSASEYFRNRNTIRHILKMNDDDEYFMLNRTRIDGKDYNIMMNSAERIRTDLNYRSVRYLGQKLIQSGARVEMLLKMDPDLEGLVLTVYNRNTIWRISEDDDDDDYGIKCFTNADYDEVRSVEIKDKIWENDDKSKAMFELKLYGDGPGYYWCEAHSVFNFTLYQSNKIVAAKRQKGHTFAMFFEITCPDNCQSIHGRLKKFADVVEHTLSFLMNVRSEKERFKNLKIHNVRVMNVESINEDLNTMSLLCHVSASLKNSAVDNSDENSSEEDDEQEDDRGIRHDTSIRMELRNLLSDLVKLNNYNSSSVNSTEFCFPELLPDNDNKHWSTATLGQTSTTKQLCLQANGLPITRKCVGSFLYGAMWEEVGVEKITCIRDLPSKLITQNLYDIDHSKLPKKEPEKAIKDVKTMIRHNVDHLIPADLFYLGNILRSISAEIISFKKVTTSTTPTNSTVGPSSTSTPTPSLLNNTKAATSDIVSIYNYLMKVNVDIIKPSIRLNSTNILLDAFERLIDEISTTPQLLVTGTATVDRVNSHNNGASSTSGSDLDSDSDSDYEVTVKSDEDELIESINYRDGVVVKITPKLIVFVIDPSVANITGVALYKSKSDMSALHRGVFEDDLYRFLYSNQSIEDLLEEHGLQLATFVPDSLLNRLDEITLRSRNVSLEDLPKPRIVVKIYTNDRLFQEDRDIVDNKVFSKIISISIPGHDRDLPELLPLILRTPTPSGDDNGTETSCRYWDYKTWANDGLEFLGRSSNNDDQLVWCGCSHLTPFAYLIGGSYNLSASTDVVVITDIHREALDIITLLGCSLSLIGIIGIFITAITFQSWREKASSKVLLQLSAAIALQMVLFCFVNTEDYSMHLIEMEIFSSCVALGACLQYSVLVQFCWMMIIAYLQFKRYVKVFGNTRPKRFFIKSFILGWGLPLIPVLLVVFLDRQSYIPHESSGSAICYPTGRSLYLGIVLPVALVILGNLLIFIAVIYNIVRGPDGAIRHIEKKMAISQIRLSVLLFFLLGFTWIFGLLTAMKAGIVFSYLFCLTATIQGFVLFVYFIILDPVTRNLWTGYLGRMCGVKEEKTMKDSTTTL